MCIASQLPARGEQDTIGCPQRGDDNKHWNDPRHHPQRPVTPGLSRQNVKLEGHHNIHKERGFLPAARLERGEKWGSNKAHILGNSKVYSEQCNVDSHSCQSNDTKLKETGE